MGTRNKEPAKKKTEFLIASDHAERVGGDVVITVERKTTKNRTAFQNKSWPNTEKTSANF